MTEDQYEALRKNSGNYWVTQFGLVWLMMLVFAAGVVVSWGYGIGISDPGSASGDGLMALLVFGLFLWCFLYLLKIRRRSTGLGRLRFTWVIRQSERATSGDFRLVRRDLVALKLAQGHRRESSTATN